VNDKDEPEGEIGRKGREVRVSKKKPFWGEKRREKLVVQRQNLTDAKVGGDLTDRQKCSGKQSCLVRSRALCFGGEGHGSF